MVGRARDLPLLCTKGEALGDLRGSALLLLTKVPGIVVGQGLLTQTTEEVDRWGLVHVACLAPFTNSPLILSKARFPGPKLLPEERSFSPHYLKGSPRTVLPVGQPGPREGHTAGPDCTSGTGPPCMDLLEVQPHVSCGSASGNVEWSRLWGSSTVPLEELTGLKVKIRGAARELI